MSSVNRIVGTDNADTIDGTGGADLIYGYDPVAATSAVSSIAATRIASGLSQPVFLTAAPGDYDRLFIVERTGVIKALDLSTGQFTTVLDIAAQITTAGEGGLLGLAFDPDYAQNGYFYVDLTNPADDTEIRRFQVPDRTAPQADPASNTLILGIEQPDGRGNHKAGWIGFGPDGYLYITLGDGGGGGDPDRNGQSVATLLGKMLRIDVRSDAFPGDATRFYSIPADNPFVAMAGALPEIWALGLRNPWRASFDRADGTFYIGDVGEGQYEEIDIGSAGANYGWSLFEGPAPFNSGTPGPGTLTSPIYFYDHTVGRAEIGGYVYRGDSSGLQEQYFFADEVSNRVFTLRQQGGTWTATERTSQIAFDTGSPTTPTSFGEDQFGRLYLVHFDGSIYRLTPDEPTADTGDLIHGLDGNDLLFGGSGNDALYGDAGDDTLHGSAGIDHLFGGPGADLIDGGSGLDFADYSNATGGVVASLLSPATNTGDAAGDHYLAVEGLIGSDFDDTLSGGGGNDFLFGGTANDDLHGQGGINHLYGGGGADILDGTGGLSFADYSLATGSVIADLTNSGVNAGEAAGDTYQALFGIIGSANADSLRIGNGGGSIWAGGGSDTLFGGSGGDDLHGQGGINHLYGGGGADILDGTGGLSFADYSLATGTVIADLTNSGVNAGEAAGDTYQAIFGIIGSAHPDSLRIGDGGGSIWAGGGNDNLFGGNGNDDLHGQGGIDHLIGGAGADTLDGSGGLGFADYSTAGAGVTASILGPGGNTGDAAGDSYSSIFGLTGSSFGDSLQLGNGGGSAWANDGNDQLFGGNGGDDLHGGSGDDALYGNGGADALEGGQGFDTFVFGRGDAQGDTLADFAGNGAAAGDQLIFAGYGTTGATFVQADATHWTINSADGLSHETIAFGNAASIHASDYSFL